MHRTAEKIREIVRIGISETTQLRAADGGQTKQRVYSLRASHLGGWLLLIFAIALALWSVSGVAALKTIAQKLF